MSDRDPVVSTWCGHARFACPQCAFDSLEEANVLSHIDTAHPIPPPKPYLEPTATPDFHRVPDPEAPDSETVTPDDPEETTTDG